MKRSLATAAVMLLVMTRPVTAEQSGRLYCGVYSMYVALQAVGQKPSLEDLIDDRYISSRLGSTLADLMRIADDHRVSVVPMEGMTTGMLRDACSPIVLHTRLPRKGSPYQHWLVFLGVENGMAKIVDPPNSMGLVPFAEILARWDGVGLVVSEAPIPYWRLARAGWLDQMNQIVLATCVVVAGATLVFPRGRQLLRKTTARLAVVVFVSLALAVGFHALSAEGLLQNPGAVASVVTQHHARNVPELSLATLREKLRDNPFLIDVRFPSAFEAGSIPGAISMPISSTTSERLGFFSSTPKDREIILYCQSNECGWSDELASEMVLRGYRNVSVYRGGYAEWKESADDNQ